MNSLRARLSMALTISIALISLLAAYVTYHRVLEETSALFDYQLRQMALSLRGQVSFAPRIEVPPDQSDSDFVIQIWDLFGTRVYLSRPGLPLINQVALDYTDLSLRGEPWRAYGLQTANGVIQIAQPVRIRQRLARASALRVIVPLVLLLPAMVAFVAWMVGQGLRPLTAVTGELQRRDERSLTPLTPRRLPLELEPLVNGINRLLTRLRAAFAAQREFIADAAHELRSPLTALRLQLQLLDRAPDEPARVAARTRLGAAIDRAIHLAEQLLTLARSDPGDLPVASLPVDLATVAAAAIADNQALAATRDIGVELQATPTPMRGDAEALRILARNLIDNAVRYTPAGGSVTVGCHIASGCPRLEVADTGPGIPKPERARVFDRFYRRPAATETGSGLGLAIAKAVAQRHGATIVLDEASGGGLKVTVAFHPGNTQF